MQKYLLSNHVLYQIPHTCYATKFIHLEESADKQGECFICIYSSNKNNNGS